MPSRPVFEPDVVDGIANSRRAAFDQGVSVGDAEAEHVDERVGRISIVERRFRRRRSGCRCCCRSLQCRRRRLRRSPGSRAFRAVHLAKPQRIHQRDRTSAHRENVADDAADAGGGALIRLDERSGSLCDSILKTAASPSPDSTRASVLARALRARAALRSGSFLRCTSRTLVAAVLGPHHRKNSELGDARLSTEGLDDAVVFLECETVTFEERAIGRAHDAAVDTAPCAATCDDRPTRRAPGRRRCRGQTRTRVRDAASSRRRFVRRCRCRRSRSRHRSGWPRR